MLRDRVQVEEGEVVVVREGFEVGWGRMFTVSSRLACRCWIEQ